MRKRFALLAVVPLCGVAFLFTPQAGGQSADQFESAADVEDAIARAKREADRAGERARSLETAAAQANEEAEKIAQEAAGLAARVQEAEAEIAVIQGQLTLIGTQQAALDARLAERQQPLIRLTGALQNFSRRPLILSVLRPGSIRDTMYLRAVLETTIPEVRQRSAAVRAEIERSEALRAQTEQALAQLAEEEQRLAQRREDLATIETRQRLAARRRGGAADREAERALALAEQARDLGGLVGEIDAARVLREDLAALPGPMIRPGSGRAGSGSQTVAADLPTTGNIPSPAGLRLPVDGRTISGFGSVTNDGQQSDGLTIRAASSAQIVTPAAGRVAFAGPFRGYGRIVIIEHPGGWISLVTGLARTDVRVGEDVLDGASLGVAPAAGGLIGYELRLAGTPVNPLDHLAP